MQIVFVYGSLKAGYTLHHLLAGQKFIGTASTRPIYRMFELGEYPGLIERPDGLSIHGELYEVTADCLQWLDDAEGVAVGSYARRSIQLAEPHSELSCEAWFWLGAVRGLPVCGTSWP